MNSDPMDLSPNAIIKPIIYSQESSKQSSLKRPSGNIISASVKRVSAKDYIAINKSSERIKQKGTGVGCGSGTINIPSKGYEVASFEICLQEDIHRDEIQKMIEEE